ncbi:MAG: PaaI family thioesterase [Desulfonauticus sp.]|nr:PaaI family thioesterase [Desulfonauticus sp.]
MQIKTHQKINPKLWGTPILVENQEAKVELVVTEEMQADEFGLIHGGTIFGLADYAAMLAVNEKNVVLAKATVQFLKPCQTGDKLLAVAKVTQHEGKKYTVSGEVFLNNEPIFKGEFLCIVPSKHVLAK